MKRGVTPPLRPRSASVTAPAGMRDSWLRKATPRAPWTWAELKRQFRALHIPADICETLQRWGASPDDLEPLLRVVRDIVFSNAVHHAAMKGAKWAAGTARDPEAKFGEELDGGIDVFYHDADVVHTPDRHDVSLAFYVLGAQPRGPRVD